MSARQSSHIDPFNVHQSLTALSNAPPQIAAPMEGSPVIQTSDTAASLLPSTLKRPEAPRFGDVHRVLIVERDPDAALALQITLGHAEFSATTVSSGDDVRAAIDRDKPHLVVLDWDLPGMITMNLLIHVRAAAKSRAPRLIALSEFSNEQRVVYALELGVDDYLVKPFSMRELVARVRALLRPLADSGRYAECVEFDRLRLDVGQARVTIRDQTVSLRTMEYRLLEFLVRHPERAFDRAQLLSRVWGHDRRAEMRAVDVTIQRIRKALTPHGCEGYLQTIRGTGYRISARAGTG